MLKLVCLEFSNSFQFISHFLLSLLLPFSCSHSIVLSLLSLSFPLPQSLPACVSPATAPHPLPLCAGTKTVQVSSALVVPLSLQPPPCLLPSVLPLSLRFFSPALFFRAVHEALSNPWPLLTSSTCGLWQQPVMPCASEESDFVFCSCPCTSEMLMFCTRLNPRLKPEMHRPRECRRIGCCTSLSTNDACAGRCSIITGAVVRKGSYSSGL